MIRVPSGRRPGLAVVLDPGVTTALSDADPRPLVLTEDRWAGRLSATDFPTPVAALARVRVPRTSTTAARTPAATSPRPCATPGWRTTSAPAG